MSSSRTYSCALPLTSVSVLRLKVELYDVQWGLEEGAGAFETPDQKPMFLMSYSSFLTVLSINFYVIRICMSYRTKK